MGCTVRLQNQVGERKTGWDKTGVVVEVKPYQQYAVKVHGSGRLTLRNRRFLREVVPYGERDVSRPEVGQGGQPESQLENQLGPGDNRTRPQRQKNPVQKLLVTGRGDRYEEASGVSVCSTSTQMTQLGEGELLEI